MDHAKKMTFEDRYTEARESVLLLQQSRPALLHIAGPDSLDLLNRMSTNDLLQVSPEEVHKTVFTNANARIIDIATVIPVDQEYLLMCWQDSPHILHEWLSQYIFFQDGVRLSASDKEWELFDILGPQAGRLLKRVEGFKDYSGKGLHYLKDGYLWEEPLGALSRYRLLCHGGLAQEFSTQGQGSIQPIQGDDLYNLLRIEAGIPRMNFEITGDSIPLEVGLWETISFTKGCYIGQEIIARMESRAKLARTLVGVRLENEIKIGTSITVEDRKIGLLTSCAFSPRLGWIGLASVKPGSWDASTTIREKESHTQIHIHGLPFD